MISEFRCGVVDYSDVDSATVNEKPKKKKMYVVQFFNEIRCLQQQP